MRASNLSTSMQGSAATR